MATLQKEQDELRRILEAPGKTGAGGVQLGGAFTGTPGTDIKQASEGTQQLLREAIKTRTGQIDEAVAGSRAFTGKRTEATETSDATDQSAADKQVQRGQGMDTTGFSQANPYAPGSAAAIAWEQRNASAFEADAATTGFQVPEPRSLEDIRQEQLAQAQQMIDATEGLYQREIARLQQQGAEEMARASSIQVGAGLAGTPFQATAERGVEEATEDVLAARRAERQAQIAQIMAAAQDKASEQHDLEIKRFQEERAFAISERDKEISRQAAQKTATAESLANMAASGLSLEDMPREEYMKMLSDSGMTDFEAKAIWAINSPEANATYSIENGQLVGIYADPSTGKPVVSVTALPESLQASVGQTTDLKFYTDGTGQGYVFDQNNPTYDENGNLVMQRVGAPEPVETDAQAGTDLLSVSEAQKLGVPFGTTEAQAAAMGLTPGADAMEKPLSGDTAKLVANSQQALKDISRLKGIVAEEFGRGRFWNDEYKSAESNIIDSLGRLRSGGAITEDEEATFRKLMPRWWNTDEESVSRLERLENLFSDVLSGVGVVDTTETTQTTQQQYDFDSQEGIDDFLDSFSSDLSRSLNGSGAQQVLSLGPITGFGSPYWQYGLDIDLRKGDPVANVESGRVIYAGNNGGFGNQVQVLTEKGEVYWYSHLDAIGVKTGDTLTAGDAIGLGGNSGSVIPSEGGDGSHLDLTIVKPEGSFYTAQEVYQRLRTLS